MKFNWLELYEYSHKVVRQERLAKRVLTIFEDSGRYNYLTLITSDSGTKQGSVYGWNDLDKANQYIDDQIESLKRHEAYKLQAKEERKAGAKKFLDELKEGDILCASWGYEAIWYDFYKVVGKQGSFVLLKELKKYYTDEGCQYGWASHGICKPSDEFASDEIIKRKAGDGSVKICSYAYAHRWDGVAREEANWH